ncbi:hypothetical protein [uncultured Roseibium sp.]|uniref:hypothetical protein n=1 Tax=uncultured Roseibium sp. TaxID=1936171 RepID=UPI00260F5451|nr:hypothetical protein [uncultured Roseibium sp.]
MELIRSEWQAISNRIVSLGSTLDMWSRFQGPQANAAQSKAIWRAAVSLVKDLTQFTEEAGDKLPENARAALENQRLQSIVNSGTPSTPDMYAANICEVAVLLQMTKSEVDYYLQNTDFIIRKTFERALLQLQWSIATSQNVQEDWAHAFGKGETQCEALGAIHLLQHGIFAFKAHSQRARTDLIYGEQVKERDIEISDGLVLTEWKKVLSQDQVENFAETARNQAALYAGGVLQGIELHTIRYIVLVSEQQLDVPEDQPGDGFVYRHKNIAVQPDPPSKAATRLKGSQK